MRNRKISFLAALLFSTSLSVMADEPSNICDHYIKDFGGPCLEGITTDVFEKRKTVGLMPPENGEILGFKIGRQDFQDAEKIFGPADQWHSGDAAASEDKVCYVPREGHQAFVLAANSEMSHGHVNDMRLIRGGEKFLANCKKIRTSVSNFRTKSGIKLGMTENGVKAILGEPTAVSNGLWFYAWQNGKELKPDDPNYASCYKTDGKPIAFLTSFITARFIHGTLDWITIGGDSDYQCPY